MKATIYSIFFLLLTLPGIGQTLPIKKDLRGEWMFYQNEHYEPFDKRKSSVSTIYFRIDASKFSTDKLNVISSTPFEIFINGQFAGSGKNLVLAIDSLAKTFSANNFLVAVHQSKIREGGVKTLIRGISSPVSNAPEKQKNASFRDFAIVGMLVLLIMMITIIRLNPKLAADYFSITKIFSMREGDDNQMYLRTSSSTNILFYAYCSLMLSYYMMIIFHFVSYRYPVALLFQGDGFWSTLIQWLELSFIVLAVFLLKIVLVYGLSFLFGMNEVAGVHFFNWVRLLLVFFGALSLILFFYFITRGQSENFLSVLLQLFAWILGGWMILIFFKLSGKMSNSMFHLFSYICATELIPFLITIKVLYN